MLTEFLYTVLKNFDYMDFYFRMLFENVDILVNIFISLTAEYNIKSFFINSLNYFNDIIVMINIIKEL